MLLSTDFPLAMTILEGQTAKEHRNEKKTKTKRNKKKKKQT